MGRSHSTNATVIHLTLTPWCGLLRRCFYRLAAMRGHAGSVSDQVEPSPRDFASNTQASGSRPYPTTASFRADGCSHQNPDLCAESLALSQREITYRVQQLKTNLLTASFPGQHGCKLLVYAHKDWALHITSCFVLSHLKPLFEPRPPGLCRRPLFARALPAHCPG